MFNFTNDIYLNFYSDTINSDDRYRFWIFSGSTCAVAASNSKNLDGGNANYEILCATFLICLKRNHVENNSLEISSLELMKPDRCLKRVE